MIGARIGSYEITKMLASGGMGDVYHGHHVELPREVVVKTIQFANFPEKMHEQLKKRFRREAYIQSQLDHPNIVRVYEFISSPENSYLVMEYVDGMSLAELINVRGSLPPEQTTSLIKQALEALDYAHRFSYIDEAGVERQGIIHRDIKPANMLLDNRSEKLKLTDFGIVKMVGEHSLTQAGFNPGTVEYMSPEQLLGVGNLDERSDLYSIGVSLYEMIAGRPPFVREKVGGDAMVRRGHLQLAPQPLSDLYPQLDPRLNAVALRALHKDTAKRFQTARDLIKALTDCEPPLQDVSENTDRFRVSTLVADDPYKTAAALKSLPPTLLGEEHSEFSTKPKSRITAVIRPSAIARHRLSLSVVLAFCVSLPIGSALWWRWGAKPSPLQITAVTIPSPSPQLPVEALRYFITLEEKRLSGAEPLPKEKSFSISFEPRVDGYLYVIAPGWQNNRLMTLVTPRPMGDLGVTTNRVSVAAGLRLKLQVDRGPNILTVIFSPQPMKAPSFLAARGGHTLTDAERGELTDLLKQYGDEVKTEVRDQETVVIVPMARDSAQPLIFKMTLTGQ